MLGEEKTSSRADFRLFSRHQRARATNASRRVLTLARCSFSAFTDGMLLFSSYGYIHVLTTALLSFSEPPMYHSTEQRQRTDAV